MVVLVLPRWLNGSKWPEMAAQHIFVERTQHKWLTYKINRAWKIVLQMDKILFGWMKPRTHRRRRRRRCCRRRRHHHHRHGYHYHHHRYANSKAKMETHKRIEYLLFCLSLSSRMNTEFVPWLIGFFRLCFGREVDAISATNLNSRLSRRTQRRWALGSE